MSKVIDISSHRPHMVIYGEQGTHVVPVGMFERIIAGELLARDVDGIDDMLPVIVKEWMESKV